MRLIDADALLNVLDRLDLDYGAMGGVAECMDIIEHAPTIEPSKSRPYGNCAECIHEYGTFGCCVTVNNEWIYDCDLGMKQYKKSETEDVNKLQTPAEPNKSVKYKSNLLDIDNGEVSVSDMAGDLVSRKILIGAIEKCGEEKIYPQALIETIKALPSAVCDDCIWTVCNYNSVDWEKTSADRPTVIRSKTLMPTKDFKEWAKRIREVNPNAVVIPCDAEVVSADRPKGKWKRYKMCDPVGDEIYAVMEAPDGKFFCDKCGKSAIKSDFCPHCGAKMK